jgi:hypothetical protein
MKKSKMETSKNTLTIIHSKFVRYMSKMHVSQNIGFGLLLKIQIYCKQGFDFSVIAFFFSFFGSFLRDIRLFTVYDVNWHLLYSYPSPLHILDPTLIKKSLLPPLHSMLIFLPCAFVAKCLEN